MQQERYDDKPYVIENRKKIMQKEMLQKNFRIVSVEAPPKQCLSKKQEQRLKKTGIEALNKNVCKSGFEPGKKAKHTTLSID